MRVSCEQREVQRLLVLPNALQTSQRSLSKTMVASLCFRFLIWSGEVKCTLGSWLQSRAD